MRARIRGILGRFHRDDFRFKVAPAVMVTYGLMVVVLLGLIPCVLIPLLSKSWVDEVPARSPWFVGLLCGLLGGVGISVLFTRAGWGRVGVPIDGPAGGTRRTPARPRRRQR